jgi:sugar phosphate isomerase/epimerase
MPSYKIDQVAIQLYTLRNFTRTLPDFVATLKKVREIGYRSVQVSGIGIPYPEAKKALDDAGLIVCATHESGELILQNPGAVSERLNAIGTTHTAYPYPAGIDFGNAETVRELARKLDAAGATLAKNGHTLSYHNHGVELTRFGDATVLDYLMEATNPAHLKAELDTYWVQYGGGDPVAWIDKVAGRAPLLHLKDYAISRESKPFFAEVGHGNLDWKKILASAQRAGVEWLIVEQDDCPGDPFDSIRKSFDYLNALLAR